MGRKLLSRQCTGILAVLIASINVCEAQYTISAMNQIRSSLVPRGPESSQESSSRSLYLISHDDFCLFGPPDPFNHIWSSGRNVVSWCSKAGHGTRLIPDGTLHGVTYVRAKDWVQISGRGDFTKINIAPRDVGGQFDSGENKPDGANVYLSGDNQAAANWVTLISADTFCVRACTGDPAFCPTQYDQMGCWFLTGNSVGEGDTWQDCESDNGAPPGVANGKTYRQGQGNPPEVTAPPLRNCKAGNSISNGQSAPPLYSWDGNGRAVPLNGAEPTTAPNNNASAGDRSRSGGGGSTTWVAVSTCTPCGGASTNTTPPTTLKGNASGTTQQGVTQMTKADVHAMEHSSAASTRLGDLLEKRQEASVTTSNGQCCSTTWTPSIVGSKPTAAPSSSGASARPTSSAATSSKSLTLGGNVTASSSVKNMSGSLSGPSASASGNRTGGGNSTSGAEPDTLLPVTGIAGLIVGMILVISSGTVGVYGLL